MGRVTAIEKVERDARVVADRVRGLGWSAVADRNGISRRQAQNIFRTYRHTRPSLLDRDPLAEAEQTLDEFDDLVERLSLLAEASNNDAVKLGALRAQLKAHVERLKLLTALHVVPAARPGALHERDVRLLVQLVLAVFAKNGVSPEVEADLHAAVRDYRAAELGLEIIS
jgi:hypothetical protein